MASSEHQSLSNFIRTVHSNLREQADFLGFERAWNHHLQNEENLKNYASAMQELATIHWESNFTHDGSKAKSRVKWIYDFCVFYFTEGIGKFRGKDIEVSKKMGLQIDNFLYMVVREPLFRLLDVGSCYNPFKTFGIFDVTAIDIAPACDDVLKCDFLSLTIEESTNCDTKTSDNLHFKPCSYHIVVFSLLLEYLPSPRQRLLCCENAYKLLMPEGLLCIITPDSKHVGANAKIMKSWRFILAKMGFSRIEYTKLPHLHCMVFRKCVRKEIAQRWASLQNSEHFFDEIIIPQDLNDNINLAEKTPLDSSEKCNPILFNELPYLD